MKKLHAVLALAILSTGLTGGVAFAQDHHDNHTYVEHKEWKKGAPIKHEDWDRGDKVDYKQAHLGSTGAGLRVAPGRTVSTFRRIRQTSRFGLLFVFRNETL